MCVPLSTYTSSLSLSLSLSLYIYIYIFILRLRPCRRPPFDEQATDEWMTLKMGHFLYPELLFWRPWCYISVSWVIILVVQGARGTPNGHLEVQLSIFIDFRVHFGSLLGPTLETVLWFVCDLGYQSGRQFPGSSFWWSRDGNDARMHVLKP